MVDSVLLGKFIGQIAGDLAIAVAEERRRKKEVLASDSKDSVWKQRPKSELFKWLMSESGVDIETLAKYLKCNVQSLKNKLYRDSFTLDDLVIASHACGYSVALVANDFAEGGRPSKVINPASYFVYTDESVLERMLELDKRIEVDKRAEYERLKAELEMMRSRYGFEE